MKTIRKLFFVSAITMVVILAACQNTMGNPTLPPSLSSYVTESPTVKLENTFTPNVETTPMVTMQPTMTRSELLSVITDLSSDNGGCDLPCIWGYDQETDSVEDAIDLIRSFGDFEVYAKYFANSYLYEDRSILYLGIWEGFPDINIQFTQTDSDSKRYISFRIDVPPAIQQEYWASYTSSPFQDIFSYYLLPHILQEYGKPSEIYIGPDPEVHGPAPEGFVVPIYFLFFYPEQGFLLNYVFGKNIEGDYFAECFHEVYMINIISWVPGEMNALSDVFSKMNEGDLYGISEGSFNEYFKSIDEFMTIDDFYETYKDSNSQDCINIPKELWDHVFYE